MNTLEVYVIVVVVRAVEVIALDTVVVVVAKAVLTCVVASAKVLVGSCEVNVVVLVTVVAGDAAAVSP